MYYTSMTESWFHVFSYGSNMLFQRIKERVNSVEVVKVHELKGYFLRFNKKSRDGSAKANVIQSNINGHSVIGIIQRIRMQEKPVLDRYEGLGQGYQLQNFQVEIDDQLTKIHYYQAFEENYLTQGKPYHWYLNFVVAGAKENLLPDHYINRLKQVESIEDPDMQRRQENQDILHRAFS